MLLYFQIERDEKKKPEEIVNRVLFYKFRPFLIQRVVCALPQSENKKANKTCGMCWCAFIKFLPYMINCKCTSFICAQTKHNPCASV